MPEGPELYLSAQFVNRVGARCTFSPPVLETPISASRRVHLVSLNTQLNTPYRLSATSRGKELIVTVKWNGPEDTDHDRCTASIRFGFGMSGCFKFTSTDQLPKHTRLSFRTEDPTDMALCFVDTRGFGTWHLSDMWSPKRGPCIITEYSLFRRHVLNSLQCAAFTKPICEVMLNQSFFNGVGNYLRAEVLFRCGVRPFDEARAVLSEISDKCEDVVTCSGAKLTSDVLAACHQLAWEVIKMGGGRRYNVPIMEEEKYVDDCSKNEAGFSGVVSSVKQEKTDDESTEDPYELWLRCYNQPHMRNLVDAQGRTIWFCGKPGLLAPKNAKSRHKKTKRNSSEKTTDMRSGKIIKEETSDGLLPNRRRSAIGDDSPGSSSTLMRNHKGTMKKSCQRERQFLRRSARLSRRKI